MFIFSELMPRSHRQGRNFSCDSTISEVQRTSRKILIPSIEDTDSLSDSCLIKRQKLAAANLFDRQQGQVIMTGSRGKLDSGTCPLALSDTMSLNTQANQTGSRLRLDGLVCILNEHNILICLLCRAAMQPGKAIERHFRNIHGTKADSLQRILSFCKG